MISKPAISIKDRTYFAGLIDGEGYIHLIRASYKKSKTYIRLGVKVGMVDDTMLLTYAHSVWGGYIKARVARSDKHRATYEWLLQDKSAELFLIDVLPFLRIKKQQAEIGLEFRKFVSKNNMVTENIQKYREHLFEGLKGLHHSIPFTIDQSLRRKAIYEKRYGKWHITEEHRQKLSESHKGILTKTMFKKGHIPWTKGRKFTEEHKRKISEANKVALKAYYLNKKLS